MRHFFCDGTQIQNPQMFRCLKCRREKNLNFPHEKDARTPRAALLPLVQAPEQNRVGRDNLKNRIEGGHNGIRFLNGNNLTVTLSKNLALFLTHR